MGTRNKAVAELSFVLPHYTSARLVDYITVQNLFEATLSQLRQFLADLSDDTTRRSGIFEISVQFDAAGIVFDPTQNVVEQLAADLIEQMVQSLLFDFVLVFFDWLFSDRSFEILEQSLPFHSMCSYLPRRLARLIPCRAHSSCSRSRATPPTR